MPANAACKVEALAQLWRGTRVGEHVGHRTRARHDLEVAADGLGVIGERLAARGKGDKDYGAAPEELHANAPRDGNARPKR